MHKQNKNTIFSEPKMIKRIIRLQLCTVIWLSSFAWGVTDSTKDTEPLHGTITVAGTGDCQSMLRDVAKAFQAIHPGTIVKVPDSIGSSGGIKALQDGKTDLARVARSLKDREIKQDPNMIYHQFAWSPVVCVVHPSVTGIDSLSNQQIVDIYSGVWTHWIQLNAKVDSMSMKIYPIAREKGDSSFKVLNQQIPDFNDIQDMRAKITYTTPETVQTLIQHKGTIGFLPLPETQKTPLRVLALNGVHVTQKTIQNGTYPLLVPFALVSSGDPCRLSKAFIEFLYSNECQTILLKNGTFPVSRIVVPSKVSPSRNPSN